MQGENSLLGFLLMFVMQSRIVQSSERAFRIESGGSGGGGSGAGTDPGRKLLKTRRGDLKSEKQDHSAVQDLLVDSRPVWRSLFFNLSNAS